MSEPFDPKTALDTIRSILLNDGRLVIRRHCYIRMGERTVDDLDIRRILEETGTINSKTKWDKKY